MKTEPLETQLRQIRWRNAPADLRTRVLTDPCQSPQVATCFFHHRIAVGLAALWLVILLLRLDTPPPDRASPIPIALARTWQTQLALAQHWLDFPKHPLPSPSTTHKP